MYCFLFLPTHSFIFSFFLHLLPSFLLLPSLNKSFIYSHLAVIMFPFLPHPSIHSFFLSFSLHFPRFHFLFSSLFLPFFINLSSTPSGGYNVPSSSPSIHSFIPLLFPPSPTLSFPRRPCRCSSPSLSLLSFTARPVGLYFSGNGPTLYQRGPCSPPEPRCCTGLKSHSYSQGEWVMCA